MVNISSHTNDKTHRKAKKLLKTWDILFQKKNKRGSIIELWQEGMDGQSQTENHNECSNLIVAFFSFFENGKKGFIVTFTSSTVPV